LRLDQEKEGRESTEGQANKRLSRWVKGKIEGSLGIQKLQENARGWKKGGNIRN